VVWFKIKNQIGHQVGPELRDHGGNAVQAATVGRHAGTGDFEVAAGDGKSAAEDLGLHGYPTALVLGGVAMLSMLEHNDNRSLACGSICAGGSLGILIPSGVMIVIYGPIARISAGKLLPATGNISDDLQKKPTPLFCHPA
jgi:hypothetical protein